VISECGRVGEGVGSRQKYENFVSNFRDNGGLKLPILLVFRVWLFGTLCLSAGRCVRNV
jgi:hypothetical protein